MCTGRGDGSRNGASVLAVILRQLQVETTSPKIVPRHFLPCHFRDDILTVGANLGSTCGADKIPGYQGYRDNILYTEVHVQTEHFLSDLLGVWSFWARTYLYLRHSTRSTVHRAKPSTQHYQMLTVPEVRPGEPC